MTPEALQPRPPRSEEEALFLAALGTRAIPFLRYEPGRSTRMALACITALAMAARFPNLPEAFLEPLREYEQDPRKTVQKASQQMARRIVGDRIFLQEYRWQYYSPRYLVVRQASTLEWLHYLVECPNYKQALILRDSSVASLERLKVLPDLKYLHLANLPVEDLRPLTALEQLQQLKLEALPALADLAPLADLLQLKEVIVRGDLPQLQQLAPLGQVKGLEKFYLWLKLVPEEQRCKDLTFLGSLPGLLTLSIQGNFTRTLALPSSLRQLSLEACPNLSDYACLSNLNNLTTLSLRNCASIEDSTPLSQLESLEKLSLYATSCRDFSALRELPRLVNVELKYMDKDQKMDLSPLAASQNVRVLSLECSSLACILGAELVAQDGEALVEEERKKQPLYLECMTVQKTPSGGLFVRTHLDAKGGLYPDEGNPKTDI